MPLVASLAMVSTCSAVDIYVMTAGIVKVVMVDARIHDAFLFPVKPPNNARTAPKSTLLRPYTNAVGLIGRP